MLVKGAPDVDPDGHLRDKFSEHHVLSHFYQSFGLVQERRYSSAYFLH